MKREEKDRKVGTNTELNQWIRKNVFEERDSDRPLRVAFYIRGYSLAQDNLERTKQHSGIWVEQYDRCCALAKELGLAPPDVEPLSGEELAEYIDHTPARLAQQDALRSLLQRLITKRDIDIVIATGRDRLSRDAVASFYILEVIESCGAKLVTADDVVVSQDLQETVLAA